MKTISSFVMAVAILLCCSPAVSIASPDSLGRVIEIQYDYHLERFGRIDSLILEIELPIDYPGRQKVHKIEFSKNPHHQNRSREFHKAIYVFSQPLENIDIRVKAWVEIFRYDLSVAELFAGQLPKQSIKTKKYLQLTGNYKIRDLASIPPEALEGSTPLEKARSAHDFVIDRLEYFTEFGEDKSAEYALSTGRGDCTEYVTLMMALCRLQGIPARKVHGLTVKTDANNLFNKLFQSSGHAWLELFFDEYGWVPFDPTHSDGNHFIGFNRLNNYYVYLQIDEQLDHAMQWWGLGSMGFDRKFSFRELNGAEGIAGKQ